MAYWAKYSTKNLKQLFLPPFLPLNSDVIIGNSFTFSLQNEYTRYKRTCKTVCVRAQVHTYTKTLCHRRKLGRALNLVTTEI